MKSDHAKRRRGTTQSFQNNRNNHIVPFTWRRVTMRTYIRIAAITAAGLLIAGCQQEKKTEVVPVGEMAEYKDPLYGFTIKYPTAWLSSLEAGHARFFSAQEVDKKFLDPLGAYPNGAVIEVEVTRTPTAASEASRLIEEMKTQGYQIVANEKKTIAEKQASVVTYKALFSSSVELSGMRVLLPLDSALYDMHFAGFADLAEANRLIFDSSLQSFKPPKPIVKGRDETLPSESFASYDAKVVKDGKEQILFTFEYPENFDFRTLPKGKNELVLGLHGKRLDCNIQFDVFSAQNLTVDKVFDQNKGKYKGASSAKTSIGGRDARYLNYSATKDVERRVYFVVKDNRVYRITMDYYKPQRQEYLAAYDKVLGSIKLK